jgi:hypothetical protein
MAWRDIVLSVQYCITCFAIIYAKQINWPISWSTDLLICQKWTLSVKGVQTQQSLCLFLAVVFAQCSQKAETFWSLECESHSTTTWCREDRERRSGWRMTLDQVIHNDRRELWARNRKLFLLLQTERALYEASSVRSVICEGSWMVSWVYCIESVPFRAVSAK